MKVRLRYVKKTVVIALEDPATLASLYRAARETFHSDQLKLSLNGKDILEGEDGSRLAEHGMVSGDLVHILYVEPTKHQDNADTAADSTASKQNVASTSQDNTQPSTSNTDTAPTTSHAHTPMAIDSCPTHSSTEPGPSSTDVDMQDEDCIKDHLVNQYLQEPRLLQDSTSSQLPQILHVLYQQSQPQTCHDALLLAVHVCMVEAGYKQQVQTCSAPASSDTCSAPDSSDPCSAPASSDLLRNSRQKGRYELMYSHPSCSMLSGRSDSGATSENFPRTAETPRITFKLCLVPLGSLLIVHGTVCNIESDIKVSVQIQSKLFISEPTKDALSTYTQLPRLSRLFKDAVAHSLVAKTTAEYDVMASNTLMGLVYEVKLSVLAYLDVRSLCRLSRTCSQLSDACRTGSVWRDLYLRQFGRRGNNAVEQDWCKMYKDKHVARAEFRARMRQPTPVLPPFMNQPYPPPPFGPIYPPGFIGGDYDRDPMFPGLLGPGPGRGRGRGSGFRPRFDPLGPGQFFPRPGRGGGMWD